MNTVPIQLQFTLWGARVRIPRAILQRQAQMYIHAAIELTSYKQASQLRSENS
jgi:hypothetical protein